MTVCRLSSRRTHTAELLLAGQRLLLLFPLAQNRSSFLGLLSQRRGSLEGLKMVALPCRPCPQQGEDHTHTHLLTHTQTKLGVSPQLMVSLSDALTGLFSGRHRTRDKCCCSTSRKSNSTTR